MYSECNVCNAWIHLRAQVVPTPFMIKADTNEGGPTTSAARVQLTVVACEAPATDDAVSHCTFIPVLCVSYSYHCISTSSLSSSIVRLGAAR